MWWQFLSKCSEVCWKSLAVLCRSIVLVQSWNSTWNYYSEEEECLNGLVQERIACVNLMSFTCQFIKREYSFRLVPARVIMQEARLAEDGAEKCIKVVRFIKKHDQPKKMWIQNLFLYFRACLSSFLFMFLIILQGASWRLALQFPFSVRVHCCWLLRNKNKRTKSS